MSSGTVGLTIPDDIACAVDIDGRAENALEARVQSAQIERLSARRGDERPELAVRRAGASDDETCVADAVRVALVASESAQIDERALQIHEGVGPSVGRFRGTHHLTSAVDAERHASLAAERTEVRKRVDGILRESAGWNQQHRDRGGGYAPSAKHRRHS